MKVRRIGVLWRFWGKAEVKWGPEVVFGVKVRKIGILWWFWGETKGKWGSVVVLG